ncbi:MAG: hypothetical protein JNL82_05325 [Myxococcales bacterium]|nr:hypothetical protein [Myxococcales bacterium]
MADDSPSTPSYRTPAADVPEPAPHEPLLRFALPGVGPFDLGVGLGAPIRLGLDRQALRLTPGSGLLLRAAAPLPPLELRSLGVDLTTGAVELGSPGLGAFEARVVGLAVTAAFQTALPWQPGRSLVDVAVQNLPMAPDGTRRLFARGQASVWLDPDARLDLTITADALELDVSHPLWLRAFGLTFGLVAARYLFDRQRVELQGPHGHGLRNLLLRMVGFFASRWLRRRLPLALQRPGYDPAADPHRRKHLLELIANLRGAPAPVPGGAAAPVPADSSPAPSDSPAAPAPADSSPAPSDSPLARLRALAAARVSADAIPPGARLLVAVPLGARGRVAVCTDRGADLVARRRAALLELIAPAGLYVHADGLPQLADLRVLRVAVQADTLAATLETSPPLGSFAQALVHLLARTLVPSRVSAGVLTRLAALRGDDVLLRQRFGASDAGVTLSTPHAGAITVRHAEDVLEVAIPDGLTLRWQGLGFLPDAVIRGLRYTWATGAVYLDATPELGDFGWRFVTAVARYRAAPHLPRLLGFQGPDTGVKIDPAIADDHSKVLYRHTVAFLGPLEVRIAPHDPLTVALSRAHLDVDCPSGVAVLVPELELDLVFERLRWSPRARTITGVGVGDYIGELLLRLLDKLALPHLERRVPGWQGGPADGPWRLAAFKAGPLGEVRVEIPGDAAIVAERTVDDVELMILDAGGARSAVRITPEHQRWVPPIAFEHLRWRPRLDEWNVTLEPATGPLVDDLIKRLIHKFVPLPVLVQVAGYLGLPAARRITTPPPPPAPGPVLYEKELPQLGLVRVAADAQRTVDVRLQRGAAAVSFGAGVSVRLPALGFSVQIQGVQLGLGPLRGNIDSEPDAGALVDVLLTHAARSALADFAARLAGTAEDTLFELGQGKPWGPLRVHVPPDGHADVHLDRQLLRIGSQRGIHVSGEQIDWLPEFQLHTFQYTFETGAVVLDISGIVEKFYHERHAVSPITQALLAHLIKVLVLPKLPPAARFVGVRSFPLPAAPVIDRRQIGLYRLQLPGGHGEVFLSMAPEDTVTVKASEAELSVTSEKGVLATLPGLRFQIQLRGARYHMDSGEIQVGGLGQLENAVLEAIVARQLRNLPAVARAAGDDPPHLGSLLDQLPTDKQGRTILFTNRMVSLLLEPRSSLVIKFTAEGLAFTADPPLQVDGPTRIDYKFEGVRYSFPDGGFHLDLENAGGVLSGLFTDVAINQVEKRLNERLKPLLPAAMRVPGYSLAGDPNSTEHIRQIVTNFGTLKRKPS